MQYRRICPTVPGCLKEASCWARERRTEDRLPQRECSAGEAYVRSPLRRGLLRLAELRAPRPVQRPSRAARAGNEAGAHRDGRGASRCELEHHVAQIAPESEIVASGRLEHGAKNGSALGPVLYGNSIEGDLL
jgi:hypothetical protein